jgi:hypothetical protein
MADMVSIVQRCLGIFFGFILAYFGLFWLILAYFGLDRETLDEFFLKLGCGHVFWIFGSGPMKKPMGTTSRTSSLQG